MCEVFLFKQKTAYERRISDWSADVCSADLLIHRDERAGTIEINLPFRQPVRNTARQSRIEIRQGLVRMLSGQSSVARLRPKLTARGIERDLGFVGGLLKCCPRGKQTLLLRIGKHHELPRQIPPTRDKHLLRPLCTRKNV